MLYMSLKIEEHLEVFNKKASSYALKGHSQKSHPYFIQFESSFNVFKSLLISNKRKEIIMNSYLRTMKKMQLTMHVVMEKNRY